MSKINKIKAHLMTGESLTPREAYEMYRTLRLGAVVFDLKKQGMNIVNEQSRWHTKYAIYRLAKE